MGTAKPYTHKTNNMKKPIFQPGRQYRFSDSFDFAYPVEEIVAELGYGFSQTALERPRAPTCPTEDLERLRDTFYRVLPNISLPGDLATVFAILVGIFAADGTISE